MKELENKKVEVKEEQTFYIEAKEIKTENNKFIAYKGYPEPKQERIDVKFRRDVKNIPTTSGYITVNINDISLDTRKRFPVLWIHDFISFSDKRESDNNRAKELFK